MSVVSEFQEAWNAMASIHEVLTGSIPTNNRTAPDMAIGIVSEIRRLQNQANEAEVLRGDKVQLEAALEEMRVERDTFKLDEKLTRAAGTRRKQEILDSIEDQQKEAADLARKFAELKESTERRDCSHAAEVKHLLISLEHLRDAYRERV